MLKGGAGGGSGGGGSEASIGSSDSSSSSSRSLTVIDMAGTFALLGAFLFSAVVFAQCMHYAAVIHVLPRLGVTAEGVSRSWAIGLGLMGALTLMAFAGDFFMSRKIYGLFAAVHAWIEVPILLAALFGATAPTAIPEAAPG